MCRRWIPILTHALTLTVEGGVRTNTCMDTSRASAMSGRWRVRALAGYRGVGHVGAKTKNASDFSTSETVVETSDLFCCRDVGVVEKSAYPPHHTPHFLRSFRLRLYVVCTLFFNMEMILPTNSSGLPEQCLHGYWIIVWPSASQVLSYSTN